MGDSCTLKAVVIANPLPLITWFRNDEILNEGGRVKISKNDNGKYSLTILQTKPNDFGVYKCVARNKYGSVTCRARMLCGSKTLFWIHENELHTIIYQYITILILALKLY